MTYAYSTPANRSNHKWPVLFIKCDMLQPINSPANIYPDCHIAVMAMCPFVGSPSKLSYKTLLPANVFLLAHQKVFLYLRYSCPVIQRSIALTLACQNRPTVRYRVSISSSKTNSNRIWELCDPIRTTHNLLFPARKLNTSPKPVNLDLITVTCNEVVQPSTVECEHKCFMIHS